MIKNNQTAFLNLCLADALIKLMKTNDYEEITISELCATASVGRTTFYRHFDKKTNKEGLLIFKIIYEWERYKEKHENLERTKRASLTHYIYENRSLFTLLYERDLISVVMKTFEKLLPAEETYNKEQSYLISYFIYGYFGIIYQWIKYGFDETPEQVERHITATISKKTS